MYGTPCGPMIIAPMSSGVLADAVERIVAAATGTTWNSRSSPANVFARSGSRVAAGTMPSAVPIAAQAFESSSYALAGSPSTRSTPGAKTWLRLALIVSRAASAAATDERTLVPPVPPPKANRAVPNVTITRTKARIAIAARRWVSRFAAAGVTRR